jgi:hypothetical protein
VQNSAAAMVTTEVRLLRAARHGLLYIHDGDAGEKEGGFFDDDE